MYDLKLDAGAWKFITDEFAKPFEDADVKFRQGGKGTSLAYTDSRTYQDRFDKVVGAQNWTVTHREVQLSNHEITDQWNDALKKKEILSRENYIYGGIETTITIFGVSKQDVGDASNVDQLKGAYSDGIKRAGTLWGVGKYFYFVGDKHKSVNTFPDWARYTPTANLDEVIAKMIPEKKDLEGYDEVMDGYVRDLPLVYQRDIIMRLRKLK